MMYIQTEYHQNVERYLYITFSSIAQGLMLVIAMSKCT